mmetsp:Transcript_29489/g.75587  ORF Transcript_29489/g.75587 Transcript_29489/m.75587 type:complete len:318 (+) Transcript_29489:445-1398(+)
MDLTNFKGYTALALASWRGNDLSVEKLLHSGADIDIATTYGYTALDLAAMEGHAACVELLLLYGADPLRHTDQHDAVIFLMIENTSADVLQTFCDVLLRIDPPLLEAALLMKDKTKGLVPLKFAEAMNRQDVVIVLSRARDRSIRGVSPKEYRRSNRFSQWVDLGLRQESTTISFSSPNPPWFLLSASQSGGQSGSTGSGFQRPNTAPHSGGRGGPLGRTPLSAGANASTSVTHAVRAWGGNSRQLRAARAQTPPAPRRLNGLPRPASSPTFGAGPRSQAARRRIRATPTTVEDVKATRRRRPYSGSTVHVFLESFK